MNTELVKSTIQTLYEETGRFPRTSEIGRACGLRPYPTQQALKKLCASGYLVKSKNNWYEINDGSRPVARSVPMSSVASLVIKWSMLAVGIGSILISIHYNIQEAVKYLPYGFAVVLSAAVVLFSVAAFETILYFLTRPGGGVKKWGSMAVLVLLWLSSISTSMSAVVIGRYSKYMDNLTTQTKQASGYSADRWTWDTLQGKKKVIVGKLSILRARDRTDKEDRHLDALERSLSDIQRRESVLVSRSPELTVQSGTAGAVSDPYAWFAGIFGADKNKIQFWLSMAPAFFVDIAAPIAIAIFLFLKRGKE